MGDSGVWVVFTGLTLCWCCPVRLQKGGPYRHFESRQSLANAAFDCCVNAVRRRFVLAMQGKASPSAASNCWQWSTCMWTPVATCQVTTVLIACMEGAVLLTQLYGDMSHMLAAQKQLARYIESELRAPPQSALHPLRLPQTGELT
jgi:hypothetical protein